MKGMKRFMPVMLFVVSVSAPSTRPHADVDRSRVPDAGVRRQPNTSPPTGPGMKNMKADPTKPSMPFMVD